MQDIIAIGSVDVSSHGTQLTLRSTCMIYIVEYILFTLDIRLGFNEQDIKFTLGNPVCVVIKCHHFKACHGDT